MGRPISVSIPHALGKEEARRRIEGSFGNMRHQLTGGMSLMFSFQEHWEGDRLHFEASSLGQKTTGRLDVLPDAIHLQIDLPEFLAALADRIKERLTNTTQKLLEKK